MRCDRDCLNCQLPACLHDMESDQGKERNARNCHKYYMTHKDTISAKHKEWYMANKEKRTAQLRAYYYEHRDEISRQRKQKRNH